MTPTSTMHVLLIGIDYYKPNRLYKSLSGAVRDINLVETFLKNTLKIPSEQIRKLISPNPDDSMLSDIQLTPDQEPTYANIIQAFTDITQTAQPDDQVYIHYSGHGGRAKTIFPNVKQKSLDLYDQGIAPMDIGDTPDGRYLRDLEMTTLLKRMTDKGLIVTVVLDCCHSGGVPRADVAIRGGLEPDTVSRSPDSLVAPLDELEQNWLAETENRAVAVAGLPQPREYVLLAACRSNEYAYEYAVHGGADRHGALTYWLIDTLTSTATRGQPLTYKLLHDRINAQIQSKFPSQTPMILGESDRQVFGRDRWSTPDTVLLIKVDTQTNQVTLNAGQAQGLSKGTRFSIYPPGTTDFADPTQQVAIVELKQVKASEAIATILTPETGGIALNGTLEPGAPAIMLSAPVDLIRRVRFFAEKTAGDQDDQLPANLVQRQVEALAAVRQALKNNGWVVEVAEGETAHYQVAIGRQSEYEISMGVPLQNLRPLLSIDDATAPQRVVDRLVHLAKYQAVQSLDNSGSKLAQVVSLEILKEDETPFDDPQNPVVKAGDIITLRLINQGMQPVKVALLDLQPTWEILQLPLDNIESPFFNLEAGAREQVQLQMSLPDDEAYQQAKEIFKLFAVQRGLADFRWLTLPPLDQPHDRRASTLEADLQTIYDPDVKRGSSQEINPLNNLMAAIGADLDNPPMLTRAATIVVDPRHDWVTQHIQLVVER